MFKAGESGNPKGRPKGAKHRFGMALLEQKRRAILKELLAKALSGDMRALEICADRLFPKVKPVAVPVKLPTTDTLAEQGRTIFSAALNGDISPDDAATLLGALGEHARIVEVSELETRVRELESRVGDVSAEAPLPHRQLTKLD